MKFYLRYRVDGRITLEIDAPDDTTIEDIIEKGNELITEFEPGDVEDIDTELIYIENDSQNRIYES